MHQPSSDPWISGDRPLRIAHFTDTYLPRRDGVITSLRTLTTALRGAGHDTLTVVPRHPDQPEESGVRRLRSLPCGVADLRLASWPRTRHLVELADWAPDLVHVHTPGPAGLLGVFAARRLGLPLVHTYHTDLHAYVDAYRVPVTALRMGVRMYARRLGIDRPRVQRVRPRTARRRAAMDAGNLLLIGGADAVVVPTPAVLSRANLPVPGDLISRVPTGVAAREVSDADVAAFRRRYGLSPRPPTVLFVGRVNREKGVELLISAFGRLLTSRPGARLVLIGAVYEPRWLSGLLDSAGVAERTIVTGQQDPDVVAAAYRAADVFAFPSRTDTQGLVLQEAALAGLPIVMVDPTLHSGGPLAGAATLSEPWAEPFAGHLERLLADPDTTRALAATAHAHASRHTPQRYAEAMLAVYAEASARRAAVSLQPQLAA
ncbi:MAG: glycosyltransferase [Micromonosporaceae bacterium]